MRRKVSPFNSVLDVRNQNKLIKNRFRAPARSRINSVAGAPSVLRLHPPRWNYDIVGPSMRVINKSIKTLREDKNYLSSKDVAKIHRDSKSGMVTKDNISSDVSLVSDMKSDNIEQIHQKLGPDAMRDILNYRKK